MRRSCASGVATAAFLTLLLPATRAEAHSRRIAHGPTSPSFVAVAPSDGISPRLILRHRTSDGAAIEADPVTITEVTSGQSFAAHLHGTPLLSAGLKLRTELVLDAPTVCPTSPLPASRYRLRDIANALRHTFTPGEQVAVTLLEKSRDPQRMGPTDSPAEVLAWLTATCAARPAAATVPPFDRDAFKQLRAATRAAPDEAVAWLLLAVGQEPRLAASDASMLSGVGLGLLESFAPGEPVPELAPAAGRQPGSYQTDPIVNHLRTAGMRTTAPAGSGWAPVCAVLPASGGSCLFGASLQGANAMSTQRLVAEAQALFVTPVSCLPDGADSVRIATDTGSVRVGAEALGAARCDRWKQPAARPMGPGAAAGAAALLLVAAVAGWLWRRRSRSRRPPTA